MDSTKLPEQITTTPGGAKPANKADNRATDNNRATDIIPDEVPRKDGPGGEGQSNKMDKQ